MRIVIAILLVFAVLGCSEGEPEKQVGGDLSLGSLRNIFEVETSWNDTSIRSKILSTGGIFTVHGVPGGVVGEGVVMRVYGPSRYVCLVSTAMCYRVFSND